MCATTLGFFLIDTRGQTDMGARLNTTKPGPHICHEQAAQLAWQAFAATLEIADPGPAVIEARDHALTAFTLLFAGIRPGGCA